MRTSQRSRCCAWPPREPGLARSRRAPSSRGSWSQCPRRWRSTRRPLRLYTTISVGPNRCVNWSRDKGTNPNWPEALRAGEKLIASWKVRRSDSCTSSPHWPLSKRFCWRSSRIAKSEQHAAFVAVLMPSGHVTRRVSAAVRMVYQNLIAGDYGDEDRERTARNMERGEERHDREKSFEGHFLTTALRRENWCSEGH